MVRYISDNDDDVLTLYETSPRAYLTLLVENRPSQTFPLRGEIGLGRDKSNSIVVADQKVSRHHAALTPIDDTFILSDQGSANGTFLNGVLIAQPTRLKPKDRISLGDTVFLFTTDPVDADSPVPPPAGPPRPAAAPAAMMYQNQATGPWDPSNKPVWMLVGCLGLIIVGLLLTLAVLFGLVIGSSRVVGGLLLLGLAGLI